MDDAAAEVFYASTVLLARAENNNNNGSSSSNSTSSNSNTSTERPPVYKVVGICLAIASGLFIGVSFVIKKVGLLKANEKYHEEAGEGYGYLKNAWWWTGMTLMILGEICNFVAYAFTDAILVTPLGALSVVVTTILSAIFLKERLSFVGKVSCFICILGSVIIVLNAPEQAAVADIQEMQHYVIAPGFLSYAGVIILGCLGVIFFVAPKYGKKSMLVYLSICSLIGGLSVVATQGLGAAVVAEINGTRPQFNQWFLYVLLVFVIATLLTEIIYLNKALNLFNAALVTPTYYVYFTSSTIVASAVLFQGFNGSVVQIVDVVMGFLVICSGVVLLQLAKSSKDVPDTAVFKGDLDQVRTVAEQEEPESEPRADTIRGGAGILRAMSRIRTKRQAEEVKRIHEERMEPIGEGETFEWDGLRRRRTMSTAHSGSLRRTKTMHPPLGMSRFPNDDEISEPDSEVHPGFFGRIGRRSRGNTLQSQPSRRDKEHSPVALREVDPERGLDRAGSDQSTEYKGAGDSSTHIQFADGLSDPRDRASSHTSSLAPPKPPPHASGPAHPGAKRQFSFQNVFHRKRSDAAGDEIRPTSRGALSFMSGQSATQGQLSYPGTSGDGATEEERLGLVQGDSSTLPKYTEVVNEEPAEADAESDEWQVTSGTSSSPHDVEIDLGRQRRTRDPYNDDYDDDGLYDEPLHSPTTRDYGYQGGNMGR